METIYYMHVDSACTGNDFIATGQQYRQTTFFIYLEGTVTETPNLSDEIDLRIRAGWMSSLYRVPFFYLFLACVCVCVLFSSYLFWTSSSLDVPAGVTQEEGHTGFLIHLPSAVLALFFLARKIQLFLSLVDHEVEFCLLILNFL